MPRILLVCEYEDGFDRLARLSALGEALSGHGYQIVFAYHNLSMAKLFCDDTYPFHFIPIPPRKQETKTALSRKVQIGSYGDHLAVLGFADFKLLDVYVQSWESLLGFIQPSFIIADNAPIVMLANDKRIPLLQVSDWFSFPPCRNDNFPRLRPEASPLIKVETILSNINIVRKKRSQSPFLSLEALWESHKCFLCHIPELDIFIPWREKNLAAPLHYLPDPQPPSNRESFFACLLPHYSNFENLVIGLVTTGLKGEAFIPYAPKGIIKYLEENGIRCSEMPPRSFADSIAGKSIVLHYGSMHIAELSLALGVPQLITPATIDTYMLARKIKKLGCGEPLYANNLSLNDIIEMIRQINGNTLLKQWAELQARQIAQRRYTPHLDTIITAIQKSGDIGPEIDAKSTAA